ncbi:uroporphyrinogen III methyltransferase [Puia dinghuensis]|uniref:Uroporphyrinogen III methyltransferase n=1 Tax=Puia dinghuensis TaxID=1792502 RepID=A0A8J2XT08_9BACT|nr:uroporphyrinogen III methyltransferase [Puia dinghuensis]
MSTADVPAPLIIEAATKGIQLDIVPFIRTEAVERAGEMPERARNVVFTSQHAVEALTGSGGTDGWKIFCTSGVTRRLAVEYFGEAAIAGTADSAAALATVIIGAGVEKEVWFFCGDQRREELPTLLREAGFRVHEVIVYRTALTPLKLERTYDGIAFFSPSGVESFFSVNSVETAAALFAIGRTTATAILARTGRAAIVSSKPDKELLIHQMIAHFTL